MARYNSYSDVPYNANANTTNYWKAFVENTLAGNSLAAIRAYHQYSLSKEKLVSKNQEEEMSL